MKHIGFYSGSFDPVTLGHLDVIERALMIVDRLIIGVGVHPGKTSMFDAQERLSMLRADVAPLSRKHNVEIDVATFDNLAVDAARHHGAQVIVRGLRDGTDFDYEMQMAGMNGQMAADIETVFLAASPDKRHIAGNLVRQIALMGGDITQFVSSEVALKLKLKSRRSS